MMIRERRGEPVGCRGAANTPTGGRERREGREGGGRGVKGGRREGGGRVPPSAEVRRSATRCRL